MLETACHMINEGEYILQQYVGKISMHAVGYNLRHKTAGTLGQLGQGYSTSKKLQKKKKERANQICKKEWCVTV